jgi:hypothetical protein
MAFKLARSGKSREPHRALRIEGRRGGLWAKPRCLQKHVYPQYDLWYEAGAQEARPA